MIEVRVNRNDCHAIQPAWKLVTTEQGNCTMYVLACIERRGPGGPCISEAWAQQWLHEKEVEFKEVYIHDPNNIVRVDA